MLIELTWAFILISLSNITPKLHWCDVNSVDVDVRDSNFASLNYALSSFNFNIFFTIHCLTSTMHLWILLTATSVLSWPIGCNTKYNLWSSASRFFLQNVWNLLKFFNTFLNFPPKITFSKIVKFCTFVGKKIKFFLNVWNIHNISEIFKIFHFFFENFTFFQNLILVIDVLTNRI